MTIDFGPLKAIYIYTYIYPGGRCIFGHLKVVNYPLITLLFERGIFGPLKMVFLDVREGYIIPLKGVFLDVREGYIIPLRGVFYTFESVILYL